MKGKFWVIEGLDGCGKTTQMECLKQALEDKNIPYKHIHFPMLNQGVYGELIAEFLRGEYGTVEGVHPKLVALLFANDRKEHIQTIINWLEEGYYVIADRYVFSNIAYQCAKLGREEEKESLKNWILDFEFQRNALPMPDKTLFLRVPLEFIKKNLSETRTGNDRDYLNGKEDIHEKSLTLQENVYREYMKLLDCRADFEKVDCFDAEGNFLPKEQIHEMIWQKLIAEN